MTKRRLRQMAERTLNERMLAKRVLDLTYVEMVEFASTLAIKVRDIEGVSHKVDLETLTTRIADSLCSMAHGYLAEE